MPLPTGTITFLFTDIEGSAKLWEQHPDAMRLALARHDALLREVIETNGGFVFKTIGDAFCAVFSTAIAALEAALTAQLRFNHGDHGGYGEKQGEPIEGEHKPPVGKEASSSSPALPVSPVVQIRVRMALHTGVAEQRGGDYFGQPLNRVARLLAVGHGGQALLSLPTETLVRDSLPAQATLHELGEHRLKDLARPETVFQLRHPDLPADFPPLRSLDNPALPNNLPRQVTRFIGRENELTAIKERMKTIPLLTLTGSGGCGKTRLALQAAADVLDTYPDGVWFVEFAPLVDPALVPQTVADGVGVREIPGEPITKTLLSALKEKRMLLALDNCEHVLEAVARFVDALLKSCPKVRLLVSSREALGIAGESAFRVPSLSVPDGKQPQTPQSLSEYESVSLFIERATAARADFALTAQNAPALASVCQRLDGIPLAIELAAARVRSLSVEEINDRLDDRFRLLTGGSRTALPRQQTLRAAIDWSYDLLNAPEKALLHRLSIFAGGWTILAAEAITGDRDQGPGVGENGSSLSPDTQNLIPIEAWEVLDLLTSLVDKSLALYEERAGQGRYRLLETVRQYARDRLMESGESERLRGRHLAYFLALAEEAEPHLRGSEQALWLERLEIEHDNLRSALLWCVETGENAEAGLRLAGALWRFWLVRSYLSEGGMHLTTALSQEGARGRTKERAKALNGAGNLANYLGDDVSARSFFEESLAIKRELGDKWGIAISLNN